MDRIETPNAGDERTLLTAWLDWQRATVHLKCDGLTDELAHRPLLPTSPLMTVAGLVSHLRWVERAWFERVMLDRPDDAPWTPEDPDREFRVDDVPLARLLAEYEEQCARAREITASLSLDAEAQGKHRRGTVTLRWVLGHMIEETARHNGHIDILREMLDGVTGD
ncbi:MULTISPECIES: DinB family protein [Actinoallomurus]|uniref:DinB family protein n=1 Tax=Actinoallomurus TaxID=667113 RepID=UPI002090A527|nr:MULTISPECIES: DinB family protein [Actinoallomurus]MCO5971092.1 DinB family protein [Actinoallomurus soli]MCO5992167.1 DinB family protein [Actinoallomurus rhizosphaericola]